jgi:hypothetical protein
MIRVETKAEPPKAAEPPKPAVDRPAQQTLGNGPEKK